VRPAAPHPAVPAVTRTVEIGVVASLTLVILGLLQPAKESGRWEPV
jgi:hypothetical protein